MILDRISELGVLRKLSWETTAHIPPSVLDKLYTSWPDLQLSVRVRSRWRAKVADHRRMDERLLSSSLLRSLTYDVIYQGYRENDPATSEWAKLTRAISSGGGSLRVLKVQLYQGGEESEASLKPDLSRSMRLPVLQELSIRGAYYSNWNDEHLQMLADSVDTSTLHTLNFANGDPTSFFKAFTGRLRGLKTLRIEMGRHGDGDVTAELIRSVDELEVLGIDASESAINILWPSILKHRSTLKSILVRGKLDVARLEEVLYSFPVVSHIGWKVPYEDLSHYLERMSKKNLERLDLFIQLYGRANDFSDEFVQESTEESRPQELSMTRAQASAARIMQGIVTGGGNGLERLTLHLKRTEFDYRGDSGHCWKKVQVRRDRHGDLDDHFEFRGKQSWNCTEEIEEELELDWPVVF